MASGENGCTSNNSIGISDTARISNSTPSTSCDDDSSIEESQGNWDGQISSWNGCICGRVHDRSVKVFWIQCDGPCSDWYNVAGECAGFDANEAQVLESWYCRRCQSAHRSNTLLNVFLTELPDHLLYKIFDFIAKGPDKVNVLSTLSSLCKASNHAIQNTKSWGSLWDIILHCDFLQPQSSTCNQHVNTTCLHRRSSKRRRHLEEQAAATTTSKDIVENLYVQLCQNTDEAHVNLATMAESAHAPLSLTKLRKILRIDGKSSSSYDRIKKNGGSPVLMNRRSQFGRTFLHACCAADYVDEGVILRCIRELMSRGADPNVFTSSESPYADRPAIFFAISRVMPKVVGELLLTQDMQNTRVGGEVRKIRACLMTRVRGRFRLVSNPSQDFEGNFTPLEFATALFAKEEQEQVRGNPRCLPPYLMRKLYRCIQILKATQVEHFKQKQSKPHIASKPLYLHKFKTQQSHQACNSQCKRMPC